MAPPQTRPFRLPLLRLYVALATFSMLTLSASLYLDWRLTVSQDRALAANRTWAQRLDEFALLASLGGAINAPGNDVFDSHDVAAESDRLHEALARFHTAVARTKAALTNQTPSAGTRLILEELEAVTQPMQAMAGEAELIFLQFRQNDPQKAAERMAAMDRKFAAFTLAVERLRAHVRQIQAELFQRHQAESDGLRRYFLAVGGAVVLMVFLLPIYGRRLARAEAAAHALTRAEAAERRRSEQSLRESGVFLQSALDALSSHIAILDRNGVIVAVNAAWNRFAQANEQTLGGLGAGGDYLAVCDGSRGECADEAPAVARGIRAVLAGEAEEFHLEYPCHSPQVQRWFIVRVTRFADGDARRVVIAHENITERKQGEVRLRAALHEVQSQQFALNESCIVDISDPQGRITHANDRFCTLSQYSREELLGQDHRLLNSGHHPKEFFRNVWATVSRGEVWRGEVCNRAKDGSPYWVDTTIVPFKDEAGAVTQHVVIRTDITARKRADEELRRAQSFLNSVIENLPVPVFIKEAKELRFVLWNRAGEALTGIPNEEMVGRNDHDFFPADEADKFIAIDRQVLASGEKLEIAEERLQTRHKGMRTVHVTKVPVFNDAGEATFLLGIAEDITEQNEADAKLSELNRRLHDTSRRAGMAEVATGVLHNVGNVLTSVNVSANLLADQVRKAPVADLGRVVALLREQGANLGEFFANDPRGPKVPGFLAQLAETFNRQQARQLEEVAALRNNIEHIKDIVAMQQSFAKVSGLTEDLNPAGLVDDAVRLNAGSFQKHEVEVVRELDAGLPPVRVDKHQVLQILVNLLSNAKHACNEAGRVKKCIRVRGSRANGCVRITVTDNGVGIPPENLNRIFNHGFTTKKSGHGFGLHSAANAAKAMGGSLVAHSDGSGQGASFTLELPAQVQPAPDPAVSESAVPANA